MNVKSAETVRVAKALGRPAVAALALVLVACAGQALDYPHNDAAGNCNTLCHVSHSALGDVLTNQAAIFNVCSNCHTGSGDANDTALGPDDGAGGAAPDTSHAWGVSASSGLYDTTPPGNAEMTARLNAGNITCSVCHDQHNNNQGFPFLRVSNAGGALCAECHAAWVWADAGAYTGDVRGHPSGIAISGSSNVHAPTNLPLEGGDDVLCGTCHSMHFATSGSSLNDTANGGSTTGLTVAGTPWSNGLHNGKRVRFLTGANAGRSRLVLSTTNNSLTWLDPLKNASDGDQPIGAETFSIQDAGAGDGKLLRQANTGSALCLECHDVVMHNSDNTSATYGTWGETFTCLTCHKMHGTTNAYLVNPTITVAAGDGATFSGSFAVDLRDTTSGVLDYGLAEADGPPNGNAGGGPCEGCHTQTNSGGTAVYRNTGESDNGVHATGNCLGCHPHTGGFAPSGGGSCVGCHDKTQPNGTGDYRRIVAGVTGDFVRATHHADGVVDADCGVCHNQSSHMSNTDPDVLLKDPDTGASIAYDGTGGSITALCVNCHDADGATVTAALPLQPFGDGYTPVNIAATWVGSGHEAGLAATEGCMGCHGGADSTRAPNFEQNAHGSAEANLFSAVVAGEAVTDWTEEELCYACHDADGPSTADVETDFAAAVHHLVDDGEQAGDGRDAECSTCHGPLLHDMAATPVRTSSNAVSRVIANAPKGYNGSSVVSPITYEYELCLLCHSDYGGSGNNPGDGGQGTPDIYAQFTISGKTTGHPVMTAGSNDWCTSTGTNGNVTTMEAPWNQGGSHDTIWCSDCHSTTNAAGPHGHAAGVKVWGGLAPSSALGGWYTPLCIKCHQHTVYIGGGNGCGSRFEDHGKGNHQVDTGGAYLGGCLSCHYGGPGHMSGVHAGNDSWDFITGSIMKEPGADWVPGDCINVPKVGNCGGHNSKTY